MLLPFLLGIALGAGTLLTLYLRSRSANSQLEEDKQLVQQEKLIVVDFMHNLVESIGQGTGRQELFERIVHAAVLSTGALSAAIFELTEDGKLRGAAVEGLFPPQRSQAQKFSGKVITRTKFIEQALKAEVFDMGEGIIGNVAKTGKPEMVIDGELDPRVYQHDDDALRIRSMIAAPVHFRGKVLGVLAVVNPSDGGNFNETDFSLVTSLAEQAGLAVHNVDLVNVQLEKNKMDFDLTLASSIQGMLLPEKFPVDSRLDIDAFYRPAQKIGGDLYDVFSLGMNRVGVVIADVSGKGVPASLLMAICQTNLRHFARRYDSPSEVLSAMNQEMEGGIRQDMFITIVYAIIDTEAEELTLARGGHEQPLLLQHDPESGDYVAHSVSCEGMALGMVPPEIFDTVISEKTIPFRRNDIFVLYTDGVTEATNSDGIEYGSARLAETVKTLRNRSAHELDEGLVQSVERFGGHSRFADDLTLITIKCIG